MSDLPTPETVENQRRSVAMLTPGAPALNRDEALVILSALAEALRELSLARSTQNAPQSDPGWPEADVSQPEVER